MTTVCATGSRYCCLLERATAYVLTLAIPFDRNAIFFEDPKNLMPPAPFATPTVSNRWCDARVDARDDLVFGVGHVDNGVLPVHSYIGGPRHFPRNWLLKLTGSFFSQPNLICSEAMQWFNFFSYFRHICWCWLFFRVRLSCPCRYDHVGLPSRILLKRHQWFGWPTCFGPFRFWNQSRSFSWKQSVELPIPGKKGWTIGRKSIKDIKGGSNIHAVHLKYCFLFIQHGHSSSEMNDQREEHEANKDIILKLTESRTLYGNFYWKKTIFPSWCFFLTESHS